MKKKGITLIALIITIVILLILAGVTMSFVVGDNGVVTQAQKSRIRTDEASAKEEIDLEVAGSRDDEGYLDLELLNENLMKNLKDLKLKDKKTGNYNDFDNDKIKIENLPATLYYKQTEVTINDKQLISNVAKDPENYGMYVDYPIDLDGDESTSDWKIFYEDETERVFLIAADYVPNSNEELKIAQGITDESVTTGTENAKMTTSGVCCNHWTSGSAPSYTCNDGHNKILNQDKQQCSFPEIFMLDREDNEDEHTNNHYYCSSHVGKDSSKYASALQCTGNWSSFVSGEAGKYGQYAIGGPTLEMWVASWNQKHGEVKDKDGAKVGDGITLFANGNKDNSGKAGYCVGTTSDCTDTYKSITSCSTGWSDKLYFPHKNQRTGLNLFNENGSSKDENASCIGYWLASPSACGFSGIYRDVMIVRTIGGVGIDGSCNNRTIYGEVGVRPIVLLNSKVYVEVQEELTAKDKTVIKSCRLVK